MIENHVCNASHSGSDILPRSAAGATVTIPLDENGLADMDQDDELMEWDRLPDDEIIQLRKIDLDTIYISIVQVSLALLAGDAELRSLTQGDKERADENWNRKVQALNDSRGALRRLLKRVAERSNIQGGRT